jgi:RNA polymerase sigma factor (sigma-70 family)
MGVVVSTTDESIYRQHRDDLIRYAAAVAGRAQAEDVLSTVMVRVLARGGLTRFDDPRPYLFKAVLNEARSLRRRRATTALDADLEGRLDPDDVDLLDAVMRLPARQRAAVYLVYWDGRTVADTAALMGATPGTIKRYLHLARQRLRGVL